MIKGVIFDMDGVLVDSEQFYHNRREVFLKSKNFVRIENTNFVGSNEKAIWEALVPFDAKLRQQMMMEYRVYRKVHPAPYEELINPQVHDLFTELKQRGLLIAIASSSDRNAIERVIKAGNITDLVDYTISGVECSAHKPDPEIYQKALAALELTTDEVFAVEDSSTGIASAINAGLRVYALKPTTDLNIDQSAATDIITELNDILNLI